MGLTGARRVTKRGVGGEEFNIPHDFVADIALAAPLTARDNGAVLVELEALTLVD